MKVRETIGTTVRTMLNMEVTTDGENDECDYKSMGERRTTTSVRGRGVRDSEVTTCAGMVYIAKYNFMVVVLKSEGEAWGRGAELRWKLWLSEKVILVWARLMEEMIKVGEIVGTEFKGTV